MSSAGLITLFIALSSSPPPNTPKFKEETIVCKDIDYTYTIDGYKYVGISINKRNYLTNETSHDILVNKIERECY